MRGDVSLAEKTQKGPKATQSLVASIVCIHPSRATQQGALASRPEAAPQGLAWSPEPQTLEYWEKIDLYHTMLHTTQRCHSTQEGTLSRAITTQQCCHRATLEVCRGIRHKRARAKRELYIMESYH